MIPRRGLLAGLAGLSGLSLAGCGSRHAPLQLCRTRRRGAADLDAPRSSGLDAVIDISHNVTVSDFGQVRKANILAVIHKTTEGGDWIDPSYAPRRVEAESNGPAVGRLSLRHAPVFRGAPGADFPGRGAARAAHPARARLRGQRPQPQQHHDPAAGRGVRAGRSAGHRPAADRLHPRRLGQRQRSGRRGVRLQKPVGPAVHPRPMRSLAGRSARGARWCPTPGPAAAGGSGSTSPTRARATPPTAPPRAPFPASPTATATCSPATPPSCIRYWGIGRARA